MKKLIIKRFVNKPNSRSHVNCNTNHVCNVMHMSLGETFCSIERINPDDHLILKEFIWKFIEIPVCICWSLSIHLLHFSKVISVSKFVNFVVFQQHLLRNMLFIDLIWLNVWLIERKRVIFTFFFPYEYNFNVPNLIITNNSCSWVELSQIVFNSFLNEDVSFSENITRLP